MLNNEIVKPLITIGLNADNQITVIGPLDKKGDCVLILSDALKLVVLHKNDEESKISTPTKRIVLPGRG